MKIKPLFSLSISALLFFACASNDNIASHTEAEQTRLVEIATKYFRFDRADWANQETANFVVPEDTRSKREKDSMRWQFAIADCMPEQSRYANIPKDSFHVSLASKTGSPHGNKLYELFVNDLNSYADSNIKLQPEGQVLVKETWIVRQIPKDSITISSLTWCQSKKDSLYYTPIKRSDLFIMYKEKKSEFNDEGWVYGIVSLEKDARKPEVLFNGKISKCIGCHRSVKYDRIFGLR